MCLILSIYAVEPDNSNEVMHRPINNIYDSPIINTVGVINTGSKCNTSAIGTDRCSYQIECCENGHSQLSLKVLYF